MLRGSTGKVEARKRGGSPDLICLPARAFTSQSLAGFTISSPFLEGAQ
jgi:hypothetical protein